MGVGEGIDLFGDPGRGPSATEVSSSPRPPTRPPVTPRPFATDRGLLVSSAQNKKNLVQTLKIRQTGKGGERSVLRDRASCPGFVLRITSHGLLPRPRTFTEPFFLTPLPSFLQCSSVQECFGKLLYSTSAV